MEDGLYEIFFHNVHGTGTGVVYATGGKLRGGNSAFAFIGSYQNKGQSISVMVSTRRYNPDPGFKPLFGIDAVMLSLTGHTQGDLIDFEGSALQLPGVTFKARLTRISD